MLCYYINKTAGIQNIRVMREAGCLLERIIFAKERVLFEAWPDCYLEIYSQGRNETNLDRVDCKLYQINEGV